MDPLLSALALGCVLGVQHATDADHLVAVATIATRERRFIDGVRVGALWGLGHMLTLTLAGTVMVAANLTIGPGVRQVLELGVALMLVLLGAWRLRDASRGIESVVPEHLIARHHHGHAGAVPSHLHAHGDRVHQHPHLHPSRRLHASLSRSGGRVAPRAIAVGAVHGLAGSAALSLLVLATLSSPASAALYLAIFGLGTIAGMSAFTGALAYPVSIALRFERLRRAIALGAGAGSIAFGLSYVSRVL